MRRIGYATLAWVLWGVSPAHAQDFPTVDWGPMISTAAMGPAMDYAARAGQPKPTRPDTARPEASASLDFTPSAARRRATYAEFVERYRRVDSAGASEIAKDFANDPIGAITPMLAKIGLRTDNLADAYTIYWISVWEVSNGVDGGDPSRAKAAAVRAQASRALLGVATVKTMPDAQKQMFADNLLLQAILLTTARDQAAGDRAKLEQAANAAEKSARGLGIELHAMRLTDSGFTMTTVAPRH